MISTRPANHHRVTAAGNSAGQPLNRVFERHSIIRRITDLDDNDYQRLVSAATWLRANPASGMLLRQLPIEGIDTKWLSRHAQLVLAMLEDTHRPSSDEAAQSVTPSGSRRLQERLGLRVPPELIQVAVLDHALRAQLADMRHMAASVDDLNRWEQRPTYGGNPGE